MTGACIVCGIATVLFTTMGVVAHKLCKNAFDETNKED